LILKKIQKCSLGSINAPWGAFRRIIIKILILPPIQQK